MLRKSTHKGKPAPDVKCADGFVDYGWRKVTKGGYVTMHKQKHYGECLKEYIGQWVMIESDDCWGIHVSFLPHGHEMNQRIELLNESEYESEQENP